MRASVHHSYCRLCPNGCPILVHVEDNRAVKVTGDPGGPVHRGYICHRGRALPELMHAPDRLLHSLKREATGEHRPILVEDAMDEVAGRLREIVDRHGPRAVATYVGTQMNQCTLAHPLADSFMDALGSPMRFSPNTIDQPGKQIARGLHGYWMAPPQGFDEPEVILWIGINPMITYTGVPCGDPGRFLKDAKHRGVDTIVIDPRRSDTARRASLHIQPRPGYDVAILAAIVSVILDEELFDVGFVDENVTGVNVLREAVRSFTPERVAHEADVDAEDIRRVARIFGRARRGYAVAGTGPNMGTAQGTLFEYLVLTLDTLCGHYLRAGERVRTPGTLSLPGSFKAQAIAPVDAFGYGERLRVRGLTDTLAGLPVTALADEILMDGDGQVRALLVLSGNPVVALPDQARAVDAMEALDLLVAVDVRMSHTAQLAHYVIAPTMSLEVPAMRGDSPGGYANGYGGYVDAAAHYTPAVLDQPSGSDLVEEWELFYGLANRLGLEIGLGRAMPFRSGPPRSSRTVHLDGGRKPTTEEIFSMMTARARVPLDVVKGYPSGALFPPDPPVVVEPKDHGWQGRLDVGNPNMMNDLATLADLPDVAAPLDGELGFRLVCRRMHQLNSSYHVRGVDRGRRYNPAFMHPDDLDQLRLRPGDHVDVRSAHGSVRAVVAPDTNLRRGIVSMAHGFGDIPGHDRDVRATGSAVGRLLSVDAVYDRYSGQPLMSNVPVAVVPIDQGAAVSGSAR